METDADESCLSPLVLLLVIVVFGFLRPSILVSLCVCVCVVQSGSCSVT